LGNSPHKFVWYDRTPEEFAALTAGLRAGRAWAEGKWLFLPLEPGYVLLLGEWGGRIRYHEPGEVLPAKRHLDLTFTTGAALSATTQMWGGVHLCEAGHEHDVKYVKDMRPTPADDGFDRQYFGGLVVVARKGGNVLGWAALSPVSSRCVYRGVAEVSLYVGKDHRGMGIGSALLGALVELSEEQGIWTLQGGTFPENGASLALQKKFGFRIVGTREKLGRMDGRWRDVVLTERRSPKIGVD
jgi:phosphinothricin acetyltransferase